jgi:hypothetical protein
MPDFLLDNDETLMKYLDGEMNQTEKDLFESQLQKDMSLKERLESLQLAIASVQQYCINEKVKSIHSEMMQELSPVHREAKILPMKRIVRYGLAVAASIIVILVGVNLFTASRPSSEKLFNEAFVDYDASGSRANEQQTDIARFYQNQKYNNVIDKAGSQKVSQKDSLLVALSYLKARQTSEAIEWFKSISIQNPVRQDAEFYLALAYLKNKNYSEAFKLMEQIHSNSNHVYHDQFSDDYISKVKNLSSK